MNQRVGTAVVKFERGEIRLDLFRLGDVFVWFRDRKPFGPPLATPAAAVQFLREVSEIYNYTLERVLPHGGERVGVDISSTESSPGSR